MKRACVGAGRHIGKGLQRSVLEQWFFRGEAVMKGECRRIYLEDIQDVRIDQLVQSKGKRGYADILG